MKRGITLVFLTIILLITPFAYAQEYSTIERLTDNVKLLFSSGDRKIQLALEIREKEINSALEKIKNGEDSTKNIERAQSKLQLIQEKVSVNTAEEVKASTNQILNQINQEEQLQTYALEEKKTGLVADLVVEVNGKEGQTLTREVVKGNDTGKKTVMITIMGADGQTKTIESEIGKISNEIAERTISNVVVESGENSNGDDGLKPEIKTSVNGEGLRNDPLPTPDLNKVNPDLYDPNARAPGDTIDETYDDDIVNKGSCGDGVDCGDGSAEPGTEGTNDIAPSVESNEGD